MKENREKEDDMKERGREVEVERERQREGDGSENLRNSWKTLNLFFSNNIVYDLRRSLCLYAFYPF